MYTFSFSFRDLVIKLENFNKLATVEEPARAVAMLNEDREHLEHFSRNIFLACLVLGYMPAF